MSNVAQAHKHAYTDRVKRKSPLIRYRQIGSVMTEETVGLDWLLCWKCECGQVQTYDLVREVA